MLSIQGEIAISKTLDSLKRGLVEAIAHVQNLERADSILFGRKMLFMLAARRREAYKQYLSLVNEAKEYPPSRWDDEFREDITDKSSRYVETIDAYKEARKIYDKHFKG
jgi:rhamnose utilization protein RhaD (predicted bifunctional aldolase and dehydrogenase)